MIFTWLPLNLPQPPAHFLQRAVDIATKINSEPVENIALNQGDPAYINRRLLKDGEEINSRIQFGYDLGEDWKDWVRKNLVEDFVTTGGRLSIGKDTATHGAHSDNQHNGIPVYKLYYLIDPGSPDTTTMFFKEHGQPIQRKGTQDNVCRCDDYSKLEVLEAVKFPIGQWVLLNTNVMHGVENVSGTRINLAVIIATDSIETVLLKLNKKVD